MFTAWLYQLGDTGGLRGGPAAGGELACGQSALQLLVRELLRPAGLLDVDVAVGRLPLLVEHGELAGQGPDDGMEAVEDGGVVEAAHLEGGAPGEVLGEHYSPGAVQVAEGGAKVTR